MKIVFISLTGYTINLMRFKRPYSLSLDREADIFPHYFALVAVFRFRIFQWEYVVWTAFIAGVIQTLLYADFMYYFFKANQNDRFMVFPV